MYKLSLGLVLFFFFFSSRRRHTRSLCDWSSDVCSSDLAMTVTTRLALQQFLALPETKPASEFTCGEVTQKALPTRKHSLIQGRLCALFRSEERRVGKECRSRWWAEHEENTTRAENE